MRILVSSINFHPDHSGIALYATDLPVFLAERGHDVTMVTGFPYYPYWRKRPADGRRWFRVDHHRGVRVLRGWLYVPAAPSTARRIVHEISFALFAALNFLRAGRHDCVVVLSPPLLLGVVGVVFATLWRARLVVNVQDLQPDAALSLGMVAPSPLTRALLAVEAFVYRHSDHVSTISQGMRRRLIVKGVPAAKLALCHNWIDVAAAQRRPPAGRFRARHREAAGKLVVAYAGNVGAKQGLDVLVDLADALRAERDVHFFLIGEGADRPRLAARVDALALPNLTALPFLDADAYREMLADVDVSFIAQRAGAGDVFFPSKLLGIMAMGTPVLVAADARSELTAVVRETGCGLGAAPGDVAALAAHVGSLRDPALRAALGARAAEAVWRYDRATVLTGFASLFETVPSAPGVLTHPMEETGR
jgi:colanic acid biosynthesis glycosyl transferase WcaI